MDVKLKNITKSFDGEVKIRNLSYDFPKTGVVAVTGESGVGKTTLARIICGLDTSFEGVVVGGGLGNVAVAFQEYRLFPSLSALDNVIFANFDQKTAENTKLAEELLFELGFEEYETKLKPAALSGGMKQRVSLARAFASKAEVIILDEATKELDSALKSKVLEIIARESKRRLVILITHDINEADILGAKTLHLVSP